MLFKIFLHIDIHCSGFPCGVMVKNPPASAGETRDAGSIPGSGRSQGGGNGNPLQYSCLDPWTEEPGGLQSLGLQRVRHNWATEHVVGAHPIVHTPVIPSGELLLPLCQKSWDLFVCICCLVLYSFYWSMCLTLLQNSLMTKSWNLVDLFILLYSPFPELF